jgi:HAD superfamily hydrolase (TIGR01509 family)
VSAAGAIAAALARRRVWFCDLDGTLVDSGPVHAAAFRDAIGELAPGLLGAFRYELHAGTSTRQVFASLGAGAELADRLVRRKQQLYRSYVDAGRVAVLPGAHRLLDRLARNGCTAYLVTSGSRESVARVLAACSLRDRFQGVLTGDDVRPGKPDPGFYLAACRRWAVDPAEAVAVEDSAHGVASAVRAGLLTLQVHAADPSPAAFAVPDLDTIVSFVDSVEIGGGAVLLDGQASRGIAYWPRGAVDGGATASPSGGFGGGPRDGVGGGAGSCLDGEAGDAPTASPRGGAGSLLDSEVSGSG